MAIYKTPDVYVEEISIFPPSVAEVETAIPAFIGYTEKADKISTEDLLNKPTRITSMLDFIKYYGGAAPLTVTEVQLDDNNNFKKATTSNPYFLYDSVRMFYTNGGGDCYIVAVGTYPSSIAKADLDKGLAALETCDEPTIILYPDAVNLSGTQLYTLQASTLQQCEKLKDRVGVFDLKKADDVKNTGYYSTDPINDFRNNVGINSLKYGMAYTPWLNVTLQKNVTYANVKGKIKKNGATVALSAFTTTTAILNLIDSYDSILEDKTKIKAVTDSLFGSNNTFRQKFDALELDYSGSNNNAGKLAAISALLFDLAEQMDLWLEGTVMQKLANTTMISQVGSSIETLSAYYLNLVQYDNEAADTGITGYDPQFDKTDYSSDKWGDTWDSTDTLSLFETGDSQETRQLKLLAAVKAEFEKINDTFLNIVKSVASLIETDETSLLESFPLYKTIITGINDSNSMMPPSGAVVGVYAAVDRERGVWKAPANVSLNAVVGPTDVYTASQLEALNIDVNGGKSINAIRSFTGRGTLIWGARTLAGNDNEWRYVPVRRFYNTVEESIKKSTYWAVFEPNNANTWIKVKGMIENYLTNKWKDGALVGAKPDDAFFVRVGLGSTMTAQDILEGYMKVEIGMAVVRPAEFIVLKFSHKLQQS